MHSKTELNFITPSKPAIQLFYSLFGIIFHGAIGLAADTPAKFDPNFPVHFNENPLETYQPEVKVITQKTDTHSSSTSCQITTVQLSGMDPITFHPRRVEIQLFSPQKKQSPIGSVLIVPPIYGDTPIDFWNSQSFCKAGLQTALIQKWDYYEDTQSDLKSHDRGTLRAVTAIRHTLEYLVQLHPGPVGIFGTSLGALTSSIALSIDPRLTTGVLIVGGGPVASILSQSKIKNAVDLKKRRMDQLHLKSKEDYQEKLQEAIQLDTVQLAQQSDPKKLWMFIATRDTIVPTSTQWNLWEAWNKPQHTEAFLNHTGMIIYTYAFWSNSIRNFFLTHLTAAQTPKHASPSIQH